MCKEKEPEEITEQRKIRSPEWLISLMKKQKENPKQFEQDDKYDLLSEVLWLRKEVSIYKREFDNE